MNDTETQELADVLATRTIAFVKSILVTFADAPVPTWIIGTAVSECLDLTRTVRQLDLDKLTLDDCHTALAKSIFVRVSRELEDEDDD
jgi:hypothetical protein